MNKYIRAGNILSICPFKWVVNQSDFGEDVKWQYQWYFPLKEVYYIACDKSKIVLFSKVLSMIMWVYTRQIIASKVLMICCPGKDFVIHVKTIFQLHKNGGTKILFTNACIE